MKTTMFRVDARRVVDIKDWNLGYGGALIQDLETFARLRNVFSGPVGMMIGDYDVIHPGHTTGMIHAKLFLNSKIKTSNDNPILVVVVNGDELLREKRCREFMDLKTRCQIVAGIRGVDIVIPLEAKKEDAAVIKAIRPDFFFNREDGGEISTLPRREEFKKYGTEVIENVGSDKSWSSCAILARWNKPLRDFIDELELKKCL